MPNEDLAAIEIQQSKRRVASVDDKIWSRIETGRLGSIVLQGPRVDIEATVRLGKLEGPRSLGN